jgi:predicted O-linked N-acetylglucosamine transferase (SPINDLY family)
MPPPADNGDTQQLNLLFQQAVRLHQAGQLGEAEKIYAHISSRRPDHVGALQLRGVIQLQIGRLEQAVELIRRAVALRPDYADAHANLGYALFRLGKAEEAIAAYRRAIEINPNHPEAWNNLGNALLGRGELESAVEAYRNAIRIRPGYAEAMNNLANALKSAGKLEDAIVILRAAEEKSKQAAIGSALLHTLLFDPRYSAGELLKEHQAWAKRYAEPLRSVVVPHANKREADRRLRVGYVSPDFRRSHCQSLFMTPLLEAHNRSQFEIFCFSDVPRGDDITERQKRSADVWREIAGMHDAAVAEKIREDRIDILVDLTMHMAAGRPLMFARKPAPVQVAWLAYPGTTGMTAMDYRLTDPHLDPPGEYDGDYVEKSIRLPSTFWCYDAMSEEAVSELPAEKNGFVTFGCLNNFCKVNPQVLSLWAKVLGKVPGSRLTLLSPAGGHRAAVLEQLGLGEDRVTFVEARPRDRYLKLYHDIDIALDTFPYNGHTTSLDGFWMGVPVVTRVGKKVVGRAGVSQLENLGLSQLVAETDEQFVEIASALAGDLPRLSQIRSSLRERMKHSPVCDAAGFARGIEAAYREMWRASCAQTP